MTNVDLRHGDCLDVLAELDDASVDAVVTDPPYGLANTDPAHVADTIVRWVNGDRDYLPGGHGFMGKAWDAFVPPVAVWDECLRVLKPGGHVLAFAGSRTVDLMTLGLRLAGFDIRDSIAWLYGSGFPKSLDVSKAIDKMDATEERRARNLRFTEWMRSTGVTSRQIDAATSSFMGSHYLTAREQAAVPTADMFDLIRPLLSVEVPAWVEALVRERTVESENFKARAVLGERKQRSNAGNPDRHVGLLASTHEVETITAPATDAARTWQGWGTALKPGFEPIVVARKPLSSPGVNVLKVVESGLREKGVEGDIRWTKRPASGAAKPDRSTNSSSTEPQPTAATSVAPADESGTPNAERCCANDSAPNTRHGEQPTANTSAPTLDGRPQSSAPKSSPPTATPAPAATNGPPTSSPSTTSTAEEPRTERRPGERSTNRSSARDSRPITESFAGIATGLTGSWATVHIDRLADGTYVWPDGLPENTAGGGTVAANVLTHGTGALNIDGCRVGAGQDYRDKCASVVGLGSNTNGDAYGSYDKPREDSAHAAGRWPANVVLDETQATALDQQSGETASKRTARGNRDDIRGGSFAGSEGRRIPDSNTERGHDDQGGASRFFYIAKADATERVRVNGTAHPTVKPLTLMRWLVRLVTPPGGTVLEPFAGSGTTVEACILEGFHCVAIEREADYLPLIRQRIARRRDPVEAVRATGDDAGLFDLLEGETA